MIFAIPLAWIAVGIIILASAALAIVRDWRWMLGFLAALYLAAFILTTQHWPLGMSVVKLVTGWMATAALGMTRLGLSQPTEEKEPFLLEGSAFRLFGAAIAILIGVSAGPRIEELIPGIGLPVVIGGIVLIGTGLLRLGMTTDILRVVIGLFSVLSGFEILYAAVESSILVAALLAVANLGLALAGSYLLIHSSTVDVEEEEEQST
jgi:hypothetical protein